MAELPIKLILTDIDGTILSAGEKVVDEKHRSAMHAALDAGIHVGPASGRGAANLIPSFAGDDALVATVLATNGMQVYLDGKLIYEAHLDHGILAQVVEFVQGKPGCGLIYFDGATPYLVCGDMADLKESFPAYGEIAQPADGIPDQPIVKANVFCKKDMDFTRELFEGAKAAVPGFDWSLPMPGFLNMGPKGWNKARAVDVLVEALGITLDEVCVFGDAGNDVEMLSHVPNSVAVSNATPEAAQAARWHIGSCEEGAVADAILALSHGEFPFTE